MLLSRALCRVKSLDLSGVRAAERGAALRLQLTAWAPFDQPDFAVGLRGGRALAFAWDESKLRPLLVEAGVSAEVPLLPESLLRPPMAQGQRLIQALEGVEAQAWLAGLPSRSQWWASVPDAREWQEFLSARDAGGSQGHPSAMTLSDVPWLRRPWLPVKAPHLVGRGLSRVEALTWLTAGCLAAGLAGLSARSWYLGRVELGEAQALRDSIEQQAGPYVTRRDEALRVAAQANALARGLSGRHPLLVFDQLRERLPPKGAVLQEMQFQGDTVRVVLAITPEVSRASIVEQLRSGSAFVSVTESTDPAPSALPGSTAVVVELLMAPELLAPSAPQPGASDAIGSAQPAASQAARGASAPVRPERRP